MKNQFLLALLIGVMALGLAACVNTATNSTDKNAPAAASSSAPASTANNDAGATLPKPDYNAIARKLVTQCAGVKEGDLVLVTGGAGYIELLDAVTVEAAKAGGSPFAHYLSETAGRRMNLEVPAKYDARPEPFWMKALHPNVNVQITVPVEFKDDPIELSTERQAVRFKANALQGDDYNQHNIRLVEVNNGIAPTTANIRRRGIPAEKLAKIFWDGVNVDYKLLQARCDAVQATLAAGNEIHVTHSNGTDLKFRTTKQPVFTSDGVISEADAKRGGLAAQVFLPAGEVYQPIVLGSAEGKLVIERTLENGKEIRGLTLTFAAGKLTGMTATSGAINELKARFEAGDANKAFLSGFDIGTNPSLKISDLDASGSYIESGSITFCVGANHWLGGKNISNFNLTAHTSGGTLKVDGKALVENGALKP